MALVMEYESPKNIINVDRDDVLDGGLRAFRRPNFNPKRLLTIRFSGEQGIDTGGLSNEFMSLAVSSIKRLPIFEGDDSKKLIALDYKAIQTGLYKVAGQVLAYCLVNRGPAPNFLNSLLYSAITEGHENAHPSINDIADGDTQSKVRQLAASNEESYHSNVEQLADVIHLAGCYSLATQFKSKSELLDSLCHFLVIDRVSVAIEQFKTGLELLGVLDAICQYPSEMKACFVFFSAPLDATIVETLFEVVTWSERGSNRFVDEKRTFTFWRDFLQDLEEDNRLEKLLTFVTGMMAVPALGFKPQPRIEFGHHGDLNDGDCTRDYPVANVCAHSIRLPILQSYEAFKCNMTAALCMATTFSRE